MANTGVITHAGSLVLWTASAYIVWARYADVDSATSTLQTMLGVWYFLLGLVSTATWAMLAWVCAADLTDWLNDAGVNMGTAFTSSHPTRIVRSTQPGWTATWSYVYVVQALGQLLAMPLGAPSAAETVALLVLNAASLAAVRR